MLTKDDLVDVILGALDRGPAATPPPRTQDPAPSTRRVFLSEYEIRRRLTAGARELRIPKGAIVSPLALDWLSLEGIRIVEE